MANSGIIKSVTSAVKAIAVDGTERLLQVGDTVLLNEEIRTGDAGSVSIWLSDGTKLDLAQNTRTLLNKDIFKQGLDEVLLNPVQDSVEDEVAAIQQALADDQAFDPTTLEAPAAGAAPATVTAGNNGHTIIDVDYLNPKMTPESGFETTGINVSFVDPTEELLLRNVASEEVANTTSTELDESAGLNTTTSGILNINGLAAQSVSLSAVGATWNAANQTLLADDNSYRIDVNNDGTYDVILLSAVEHLEGEGVNNQQVFNITAELTSNTGQVLNSKFTVSLYDDGPVVSNTQGSIKNVEGEALEGLIDYNLGLDGLGGVALDTPTASYNGANWDLTSHGDKLSYKVTDIDGDNVEELHAYVDVGQAGWDGVGGVDREVFTLQALEDGKSDSTYKLVMQDVLDLPIPVIELDFDNVEMDATNTSLVVYSDAAQTQSEMLIESTLLNASNGFVGVGPDNVMDFGESITYKFGEVINGAIDTDNLKLVNDLQLSEVNVEYTSVADAFQWIAYRAGAEVARSFQAFTSPDTEDFLPKIYVNGGLDTLVISAIGDFQVGGVKYCDCSDIQDIDVHFGFTAIDNDTDKVSGDFTVIVGDSLSTAIDTNLTVLLSNPDSVDLTV